MNVNHVGKENSVLHKFLSEIRDASIQKDSMRFRRNIERIGEVLGYELSKSLKYSSVNIKTPLGIKQINLPDKIVLCSILRAGLPLHTGLLNYFDDAENAFISAYRKHHPKNDDSFEIEVEYFAAPEIDNKVVFLIDPMLATGKSLVAVYDTLKKYGNPKEIHVVSVIGSEEGIKYIQNHFPEETNLWIADIDAELNNKGYIIPGLGDAGDLAFGKKI